MQDTVAAPTDSRTHEGRHRSTDPGWFAAGSAMYDPRHTTKPEHLDDCMCRLCTTRPDIEAVLARRTSDRADGVAR